jgi:hypothetical protein
MDSMIGMFRAGGFSIDLTHHARDARHGQPPVGVHAGALEDTADVDPQTQAAMLGEMAEKHPTSPSWSRRSPTTRLPSSAKAAMISSSWSSLWI